PSLPAALPIYGTQILDELLGAVGAMAPRTKLPAATFGHRHRVLDSAAVGRSHRAGNRSTRRAIDDEAFPGIDVFARPQLGVELEEGLGGEAPSLRESSDALVARRRPTDDVEVDVRPGRVRHDGERNLVPWHRR